MTSFLEHLDILVLLLTVLLSPNPPRLAITPAAHYHPPVMLDAFFNPRSVAIIGASADAAAISGRPLRILQQHEFSGRIYPVNPKYPELRGLRAYPSIADVPEPVDLALVALPARLVPGVLEECAAAGTRFALVLSSGFAEAGPDGIALQERIRELCARTDLRVCGPNCEGFYNLTGAVPLSFSPTVDPDRAYRPSEPGSIGIVAQSGGLGFALFNLGLEAGLGFSTIISTGNEVDLEALDYIDYLVDDPATRVILAFVESFKRASKLPRIARRAAERGKPIVICKVGRSEAAQRAASSHTGSLVGSDDVYDAAFRQLGLIRVHDVEEMLDAAAYLSSGRLPRGRRVAILTVSGGGGVWLADACAANGLELPEVEPELQAEMRPHLPAYGSTANPVDATAQAVTEGGALECLRALNRSERFDVIVPVVPLASGEVFLHIRDGLAEVIADGQKSVAHYSYTRPRPESLAQLRDLGIPCFTTPGRTARAIALAYQYGQFLRTHTEVARLREAERPPEQRSFVAPRHGLSERETRSLLAPCAIPSPREGLARSADEAVALFEQFGQPVALKIEAADLPHKSDAGGVCLDLRDEAAVRDAYNNIVANVARAAPNVQPTGVLVQAMARPGLEMILAARMDPDFGPVVVIGLGGLYVEVLRDVSMRLAPVSAAEARDMLAELRGAALLNGTRGRPPADIESLAVAIERFSRFASRLPPEVASIEINPLFVHPPGQGVTMVDAALELAAL